MQDLHVFLTLNLPNAANAPVAIMKGEMGRRESGRKEGRKRERGRKGDWFGM